MAKSKGAPTKRLRPAEPGSCIWRHVVNRHLEEPGALPHAMGGSDHGVTLLPSHSQPVIRNLQLRCCSIRERRDSVSQTEGAAAVRKTQVGMDVPLSCKANSTLSYKQALYRSPGIGLPAQQSSSNFSGSGA